MSHTAKDDANTIHTHKSATDLLCIMMSYSQKYMSHTAKDDANTIHTHKSATDLVVYYDVIFTKVHVTHSKR